MNVATYQDRKAKGQCVECKNTPELGRVRCRDHLKSARKRTRKYVDLIRLPLCHVCGEHRVKRWLVDRSDICWKCRRKREWKNSVGDGDMEVAGRRMGVFDG